MAFEGSRTINVANNIGEFIFGDIKPYLKPIVVALLAIAVGLVFRATVWLMSYFGNYTYSNVATWATVIVIAVTLICLFYINSLYGLRQRMNKEPLLKFQAIWTAITILVFYISVFWENAGQFMFGTLTVGWFIFGSLTTILTWIIRYFADKRTGQSE